MSATTATRRNPAQDRTPGRAQGRIVTLAIMAVTAVVIAAAAFLSNQPATASGVTTVNLPGTATGPAPVVGKAAPPFTSTTADGQSVSLADYAGSPIWLTFGASWCQPCRAENPDIEAAYERYKARGIVVIQVYMAEEAGTVTDYTNRVGITYVKVPDPNYAVADEYRILGIPSHFFIDRTGVLRSLKVGTLAPDAMDQVLAELTG
jgi:cytochrome c biogenesis protein CcmG/thiol:disulfide interchange protein DsbE